MTSGIGVTSSPRLVFCDAAVVDATDAKGYSPRNTLRKLISVDGKEISLAFCRPKIELLLHAEKKMPELMVSRNAVVSPP